MARTLQNFSLLGLTLVVTFDLAAQEADRPVNFDLGLDNDVFVLVDVSGSMVSSSFGIGRARVMEARQLVEDILLGRYDSSRYPNWSLEHSATSFRNLVDNKRPLVTTNNSIYLLPFGEVATCLQDPIHLQLTDPAREMGAFFTGFPQSFGDLNTFLRLAEARTFEIAASEGPTFTPYLIIEITDANADEIDAQPLDQRSRQLIGEFENLENAIKGKLGTFIDQSTKRRNPDFVLQVIVQLVFPPPGGPPPPPQPPPPQSKIYLIQPQDRVKISGSLEIQVDIQKSGLSSSTQFLGKIFDRAQSSPAVQSRYFSGGDIAKLSLPVGDYRLHVSLADSANLSGNRYQPAEADFQITPKPVEPPPPTITIKEPLEEQCAESGSVAVRWTAPGAAANTGFTVRLRKMDGERRSFPAKAQTGVGSVQFSIRDPGEYLVTVMAEDMRTAKVRFVVKDNCSGAGWLRIPLILVLIAAACAVFRYKKKANTRGQASPVEDEYV